MSPGFRKLHPGYVRLRIYALFMLMSADNRSPDAASAESGKSRLNLDPPMAVLPMDFLILLVFHDFICARPELISDFAVFAMFW